MGAHHHTRPGLWPALTIALAFSVAAQAAAQEAPIRHTVRVDGHPIAVWEKSATNPMGVIVLLHGRTWSALPDFDLQAPGEELSLMDGLVHAGYATFGVDMRGYGETPRDDTGWLTPDRAAKDMAGVLEWVWARTGSDERPVLLGWSLGSMVSQLTVQRWPGLVSSVVLFGYPTAPGRRAPTQDDPGEPPMRPTTAQAAASDFITPGSISQSAIDAYVAAALAADPVRVDWKNGEQWNELDPSKVTVPTLLLQGEFDPLAPTQAQAAFFTQLGTADRQWVTIPGGDHAAFLETPRAYFIQTLVSFMRRPR